MNPVRRLDNFLNNITMYRLLVYVLGTLLAVSFVLMLGGVLSYSALGLVLTTFTAMLACFATNMTLSKLLKITPNHESGLITALILACILPQSTSLARLAAVALAGIAAIAVKFLLVIRGSHFLNPAAAGATVVGLSGLLPVTWWIGSPPLLVFTALLGLLVLRKIRRFTMFFAFAAAALAIMLVVAGLQHQPLTTAMANLFQSYPLVFLGTIMLTEPTTVPASQLNRVYYGLIVGALFTSQLAIGPVSATPHVALLLGNLFSLVVSAKRGYKLTLQKITELGPHLYDLTFKPASRAPLPFLAGQYMEWTLPGVGFDSRGNRRTFTIASSPTEELVHLGVKQYDPSSAFKQALLALRPGDEIQAGHINGDFTLPADPSRKLLLIAGGIGVTPFRSMLHYLKDTIQQRDIVVVYSARSQDEFVYQDVLKTATVHLVTDRLDAAALQQLVPDLKQRLAYLSGPNAMVDGLKQTLRQAGVTPANIRSDYFSGY